MGNLLNEFQGQAERAWCQFVENKLSTFGEVTTDPGIIAV